MKVWPTVSRVGLRRGVTLPSMDGLIAALAGRHDVPLLSVDRGFGTVPGLRSWPWDRATPQP